MLFLFLRHSNFAFSRKIISSYYLLDWHLVSSQREASAQASLFSAIKLLVRQRCPKNPEIQEATLRHSQKLEEASRTGSTLEGYVKDCVESPVWAKSCLSLQYIKYKYSNEMQLSCHLIYPKDLMFKALNKFAKEKLNEKVAHQVDKAIVAKQKKDFQDYLAKKGFDRIHSDAIFTPGFCLFSEQKNYCLTLTQGGDLRVYVSAHLAEKNIIFSSGTQAKGTAPYKLILQGDGNLVIYDAGNNAIWDTKTFGQGSSPHTLLLQDDGDLCLFDLDCNKTWHSDTSRC